MKHINKISFKILGVLSVALFFFMYLHAQDNIVDEDDLNGCPPSAGAFAGLPWHYCPELKPKPSPGFPGNPNPIDLDEVDINEPGTNPSFPITIPGNGGPILGTQGITVTSFKEQIKNKPFSLLPSNIPCEVLKKWLATVRYKPVQSVIDKLSKASDTQFLNNPNGAVPLNNGLYIQNIDDAYSTVINLDYFSVNIKQLPIINGRRISAPEFLKYIRTNINNLVGNSAIFTPYNFYGIDDRALWGSDNPTGAIVSIDLSGPDNGSVITSFASGSQWTFTTIHDFMNGDHPVSGNRNFGYTSNSDGSYTFYTRGADRFTSFDATTLQNISDLLKNNVPGPFSFADALWKKFQNGVSDFTNYYGGSATVDNPEIFRPNWSDVKAVLDGQKPLSTLSKDCPD